jgi:hypothetical protein
MEKKPKKPVSTARRDFVKKSAYLAPAILTLQATSGIAKAGSVKDGDDRPGRRRPPNAGHH